MMADMGTAIRLLVTTLTMATILDLSLAIEHHHRSDEHDFRQPSQRGKFVFVFFSRFLCVCENVVLGRNMLTSQVKNKRENACSFARRIY